MVDARSASFEKDGNPCMARIVVATEVSSETLCMRRDSEKPMAFRGSPYCSDQHRKELLAMNPDLKIDGE